MRSSTTGCLSSQRVSPGARVAKAHRRGDDAGEDVLDVFALVGVHQEQPTDALVLAAGAVEHAVARLEGARVDTDEGEVAHELVVHELERQGAEGRGVGGGALDLDVLLVGVLADLDGDVHRRGR
jgi:hypothetical protein